VALTLNLRLVAGRMAILFLLALSLGLVLVGKSHQSLSHNVRMLITDTVTPVIQVLSAPTDAIQSAASWVSEMTSLREENHALKSQNARLQQWQAVATELQSENAKLRDLLRFAPPNRSAYSSARVAADPGSPYSRSAIITSGSDQSVHEDMAVINDGGLVGRVVEVGKRTARILLLSDMNSRIPILSETSRERAIAGGNGGDLLSLFYLPEGSKLTVGEKIVTSGDGGVLPPGLPVGVVVKIENKTAWVKPFVDWYHLEYVSVVDFSM
jgi:rod shape-determining protein MreC